MTRGGEFLSRMRSRFLLGAAAAMLLPAAAQAQQAPGADRADATSIDGDIIVTAQKRNERLLDVPLAITAITGDEIARRGAASLQDLQ